MAYTNGFNQGELLEQYTNIWVRKDQKDFFETHWLREKEIQGVVFDKNNLWTDMLKYLQQRDEELDKIHQARMGFFGSKEEISSDYSSEGEEDRIGSDEGVNVSDTEIELLLDLDKKRKRQKIRDQRREQSLAPSSTTTPNTSTGK